MRVCAAAWPCVPCSAWGCGGVSVSYFEWLKNLSHVRFGRMEKRYRATMNTNILDAIEGASGTKVSDASAKLINRGADEKDLVYSGLEETMITAYDNIRNRMVNTKGINDLRTAAFVEAIDKVAVSYQNLGIWP